MFLASILSASLALPLAGDGWGTDYDAALAEAGKSDKLVLADFTGSDWCGWCIKLHDEVFSKPEFASWAEKNVVLLELDFPRKKKLAEDLRTQNQALAKKYAIRGYPTILLLDGKGQEVARTGYVRGGAAAWIADTDKRIAAGKEKQAAKPEKAEESEGEAEAWMTDFAAAKAKSKESGKPILVDFTGSDWCGWCIKLHDEVFSKPEFDAWAKKNVVLLELDYPRDRSKQSAELQKQNAELAKKYSIRGYPTILFLDAAGEVLGRSGYKAGGPKAWITHAKTQIAKKPAPKK